MILMTRPAEYEESFRKDLGSRSDIVACPLLNVRSVGAGSISTADYDALIFTSRLAVKHSKGRLSEKSLTCLAVGPGTAAELSQSNFHTVVDGGGNASSLVEFIQNHQFNRALYLSGRDVTADLSQPFPGRVDRLIVYETDPVRSLPDTVIRHFAAGKPWVAPFFSKKTCQTFERLVLQSGLQDQCRYGHAVAISNPVADSLALPWGSTSVAHTPNAVGMFNALHAAA